MTKLREYFRRAPGAVTPTGFSACTQLSFVVLSRCSPTPACTSQLQQTPSYFWQGFVAGFLLSIEAVRRLQLFTDSILWSKSFCGCCSAHQSCHQDREMPFPSHTATDPSREGCNLGGVQLLWEVGTAGSPLLPAVTGVTTVG